MALEESTGDSLFGNLKKKAREPELEVIEKLDPEPVSSIYDPPLEPLSQPKYAQLDKVTVLLTSEEKEGLDRITKKLMRYRAKQLKGKSDKERITANMLIRGLVDNFLEIEEMMELETLHNEDDVKKWIRNCLNKG